MEADDAQGRLADGQHGLAGGEQAQQLVGQELEQQEADQHDGLGIEHGALDGLFDAVGLAGTVVVADDGHHAVVHAEDGHKNEALQLEVNAEHGHGGGGKGHEDLVHQEGHHAAHALHGDAGQADNVDPFDGFGAGAEALEIQLDIGVLAEVEIEGDPCAAELADDGGQSCTGGAGQSLAAVAKDEDGVKDDVDDGTHQLADHAQGGAAGGGQQFLVHHLHEHAQAEHAADGQVADALLGDVGIGGLGVEVGAHNGQAQHQKDQVAAQCQEQAVLGGLVGAVLVLFAQALGEQGVDTHAGADAHGEHHVLQRKGQRDGGQSVLTDTGDKDRVHHVVQCLHQHGDHHRDAELDQQRVDIHGAHDVFGFGKIELFVFHDFSF